MRRLFSGIYNVFSGMTQKDMQVIIFLSIILIVPTLTAAFVSFEFFVGGFVVAVMMFLLQQECKKGNSHAS